MQHHKFQLEIMDIRQDMISLVFFLEWRDLSSAFSISFIPDDQAYSVTIVRAVCRLQKKNTKKNTRDSLHYCPTDHHIFEATAIIARDCASPKVLCV